MLRDCDSRRSRRCIGVALGAVALGLALPMAGALGAGHNPLPELPAELVPVREALMKYQDPFVAVHDGYFSTVGCVQYPDGGMGVHFLNTGLIGPEPDPMAPQLLVYEPDAEGKLHLVAAEWLIPLATGVQGRPELFGQAFDGPMAGHVPLMPDGLHHYDLHVWLFKDNPDGLFYRTNPDVACSGPYVAHEHPPREVAHD